MLLAFSKGDCKHYRLLPVIKAILNRGALTMGNGGNNGGVGGIRRERVLACYNISPVFNICEGCTGSDNKSPLRTVNATIVATTIEITTTIEIIISIVVENKFQI